MLSTNEVVDYWHDRKVRHDLMGVLVGHAPEAVADLEALTPLQRWTLGEYYRTTNDERAIPVLTTLQHRNLVPKSRHFTFQSFEQLAWFYRDSGRYEEGAATWQASAKMADTQPWMVPDALLEAARLKLRAGKDAEAKALYDQVPLFGDSWLTGMALYDQGYALIKQGKHTEARALLQQPVSGARADEVKVGMLSLLAASYLRTGEVEMARLTAQNALDSYGALRDAPRDEGFKYQVQRAKEVIAWCRRYEAVKSQGSANHEVHP